MSYGSLRVRRLPVECKLSQFKEKEPFPQARGIFTDRDTESRDRTSRGNIRVKRRSDRRFSSLGVED